MLANVVCIDFEASSLGDRGFPIEAGIAAAMTGEVRAWLIRPAAAWLAQGTWSEDAEALHGLSLAQITAEGLPVEEVAQAVGAALTGKRALSDNPAFDGRWLAALFAAARGPDRQELCALDDFHTFASGLAARMGRRPDIAVGKAELEAAHLFPQRHRAAPDARRNAEVLRQIAGVQ